MKRKLCSYRGMTVRNIKVYLKDKMAIVFSMLTQIIVLGLYLLFLKNNYVDEIKYSLEGFGNLVTDSDIDMLVNSWLVSGVIGTSVVTVALNSLGVMVSDRHNKISYDYTAAPVKGSTVVLSYFTGAVINTFLISAILLTAGLIFIGASGSFLYSVTDIINIYLVTALGSVSATLILMFIVSFFKKNSTLSSFSALVSATIGFIIGAYIPVSQFSESVQTAVNLVPGSHIAGLMRNILVTPAIDNISDALGGIDNGAFAESTKNVFAINLNIFGNEIGIKFMMAFSVAVIVLFLILNLIFYKISSKSKD